MDIQREPSSKVSCSLQAENSTHLKPLYRFFGLYGKKGTNEYRSKNYETTEVKIIGFAVYGYEMRVNYHHDHQRVFILGPFLGVCQFLK